MSIRILLADDHRILRDGLRALLENEHGLTVVGEAENGRIAVKLARKVKPDVIVMDVGMPDLNGIEATRQILADNAEVKVIALSMHSDKRFISGMLSAGASGYVLKDVAFEEVADAVRDVVANKPYLSPGVAGVVLEDYVRHLRNEGANDESPLTNREREVLQLLAEGMSVKKIASELNLSVKTIETHRQHMMLKLNVHSVAELTKYAIRTGLTSLEP